MTYSDRRILKLLLGRTLTLDPMSGDPDEDGADEPEPDVWALYHDGLERGILRALPDGRWFWRRTEYLYIPMEGTADTLLDAVDAHRAAGAAMSAEFSRRECARRTFVQELRPGLRVDLIERLTTGTRRYPGVIAGPAAKTDVPSWLVHLDLGQGVPIRASDGEVFQAHVNGNPAKTLHVDRPAGPCACPGYVKYEHEHTCAAVAVLYPVTAPPEGQ